MYCSNCGKEIEDGARFCPACGSAVKQKEQQLAAVTAEPAAEQSDSQVAAPKENAELTYSPVLHAAPAEAGPVKKVSETKWPAVIGIMGIFYLVFIILQFVCIAIYREMEGVPFESLYIWFVQLFLVALVPVLFFVHTKKVAFLTAIPMLILTAIDAVSILPNRVMWVNMENLISLVIPTLVSLVLLILYLIQMFARPGSSALSVIFLILFILNLIYLGVILAARFAGTLGGVVNINPASLFSSLFGLIGMAFSAIAYSIAMFRFRQRG